MVRPFLTCLALLLCGGALAVNPSVPQGRAQNALAPSGDDEAEGARQRLQLEDVKPQPPLYTFIPIGVGLTLNPPGAAATLSLRSPAYPPTVRLLSTFGLERNLTPLGGLYGHLRYELDSASTKNTVTYFVQAGVWPYDPHRSGRRAAASGFTAGVRVSSRRQPLRREGRLEFGLLGVGTGPLQFGSRGEFAVSDALADRWGYGLTGWRAGLAGVWSATGAAPSLGVWADGGLAGHLGGWPLEFGVRSGYRPAWPVPLPDGTFGVLVTAGTRASVPARAAFGDGLLRLERVTLEPRLRGYVQTPTSPELPVTAIPGLGADLSLSFDAVVNRTQRVAVGGTVGYAGSFWYRLNLRVQP